jgi:hypothetical protein
MDGIGFGESVRLCVNPCPLWDNNSCLMWDIILCGHILLNLGYWIVLARNLNQVNRMLIIHESSVDAFLQSSLLYFTYVIMACISFISYTC